jgi:hypothetical protein
MHYKSCEVRLLGGTKHKHFTKKCFLLIFNTYGMVLLSFLDLNVERTLAASIRSYSSKGVGGNASLCSGLARKAGPQAPLWFMGAQAAVQVSKGDHRGLFRRRLRRATLP